MRPRGRGEGGGGGGGIGWGEAGGGPPARGEGRVRYASAARPARVWGFMGGGMEWNGQWNGEEEETRRGERREESEMGRRGGRERRGGGGGGKGFDTTNGEGRDQKNWFFLFFSRSLSLSLCVLCVCVCVFFSSFLLGFLFMFCVPSPRRLLSDGKYNIFSTNEKWL